MNWKPQLSTDQTSKMAQSPTVTQPTIPEWSSHLKKWGVRSWVEKITPGMYRTVHSWKLPIPHELSRFCFFEKTSRARATQKGKLSIVWDKACLVCSLHKKQIWLLLSGRYWLVTNSWKSLPSGWAFLTSLGQLLRKTAHQQAQMAEKHTCYAPHKVGKHTPLCKLPAGKRCRFATNRSSNWNEPQKKMRENHIYIYIHVKLQKDMNCRNKTVLTMQCTCQTQQKKVSGGFCWWTPPPKKWSFRKWIVFCPFCKKWLQCFFQITSVSFQSLNIIVFSLVKIPYFQSCSFVWTYVVFSTYFLFKLHSGFWIS